MVAGSSSSSGRRGPKQRSGAGQKGVVAPLVGATGAVESLMVMPPVSPAMPGPVEPSRTFSPGTTEPNR